MVITALHFLAETRHKTRYAHQTEAAYRRLYGIWVECAVFSGPVIREICFHTNGDRSPAYADIFEHDFADTRERLCDLRNEYGHRIADDTDLHQAVADTDLQLRTIEELCENVYGLTNGENQHDLEQISFGDFSLDRCARLLQIRESSHFAQSLDSRFFKDIYTSIQSALDELKRFTKRAPKNPTNARR